MQKPQHARQCQRHDEMREAAPWCGRLGDGDDGDMECRKREEKKGKKKKESLRMCLSTYFPPVYFSISPHHSVVPLQGQGAAQRLTVFEHVQGYWGAAGGGGGGDGGGGR